MSGINRLQDVIAQIRRGMEAKAPSANRSAATRKSAQAHQPVPPRLSAEQISTSVQSAIAGLNPSIPSDRRLARRLFVETVLLAEFGVGLADDPKFLSLSTSVEAAMSEDSELSAELDDLLSSLAQQ